MEDQTLRGAGQFAGFTIPEGAWLPPEFFQILPEIDTLAEMKVTLALIGRTVQLGVDSAAVSQSELQAATGLSRLSVAHGVQAALARGTIEIAWLRPKHGTRYRLVLASGCIDSIQQRPCTCMHEHLYTTTEETHIDTMHAHDELDKLRQRMAAIGVSTRIARDILNHFSPETIARHLNQTEYASAQGLARSAAAWFVASVRDDWSPPAGMPKAGHHSLGEDGYRYISGKYAEFIEH
jgi:hypothetical protein